MKKTDPPQHFTRARFVKIAVGAIGGSVGAYVLYELAPWMDAKAASVPARMPLDGGTTANPPMRELVRYATLAASGHNAQPWQFIIGDHSIQIQPDAARRLTAVDPNDRELWISLGCALENLSLAARKVGFEPEITYPDTSDWIKVNLTSRRPEEQANFASILLRQNTRSEYDGQKLGTAQIGQLASIPIETGVHLRVFDSKADTEKILQYVTMGDLRQFNDKAFVNELIHWIRFDKREAMASMDGLYSGAWGAHKYLVGLGSK